MCLVFEPRVPSYDSRGRARGPGARDRSSSARSIHDVSIRGRPSTPSPPELDELRARLQQTSVSFGIPSFNEGAGVVHTLQSVLEAASSLGLRGVTVILSDSSETTETVDAARAWAQQKDVQLLVDRSERRRSAKEARNVLMARASSEILVQVDADVILARHLIEQGIEVRNCWRAVVYKLPAATLRDFMLQTHRGYAAGGAHPRRRQELGAAAVEAAKDPLGALLYARARLWSAREQRRRPSSWEEEWDVARSTKRG